MNGLGAMHVRGHNYHRSDQSDSESEFAINDSSSVYLTETRAKIFTTQCMCRPRIEAGRAITSSDDKEFCKSPDTLKECLLSIRPNAYVGLISMMFLGLDAKKTIDR